MTENLIIEATKRVLTGRQVSQVRRAGFIPAVVYGPGIEPVTIQVSEGKFLKTYRNAGESTLVDLSIDGGKSAKVLIQEVQHDPVKNNVIHVDFRQVRMDEELETDIQLVFIGESLAVKALGGSLVKNMDAVLVRCLPGALISHIEVDLGKLATFEESIQVKDIVVPDGIKIVTDGNQSIAYVEEPRTDAEMQALEQKPEASVESVEVVGKKKDEEVADGEAEAGDAKKE